MSASVNIEQWTGSGPTITPITSGATITSGTNDNTSPPPIPQDNTINGGSFRFAYWTNTRLNAATAPTGILNNVQWYCSTSIPGDWVSSLGSSWNITCNVSTIGSYVQASGTPNVSGNTFGGGTSIFNVTAGNPLIINGSVLSTATFPNDTWTNFALYQFRIPPKWASLGSATNITPGTKSAVTFNWQYDEV